MEQAVKALLLLFFCGRAYAAALGLHLGSHHFPDAGQNDFNPGAYVQADSGAVAGVYLNSQRHWSVYAGYSYQRPIGPFQGALTMGVVTGYRRMKIMPMAVPSLGLPLNQNWNARLAFVPKFEKNGASVIHLMLERHF